MPIDLNAIRARVEAATKGPWTVIRDPKKPTRVLGIEYVVSHNHTPDAPCRDDGGADDCPASPYKDRDIVKTDGCYPPNIGDAEFIASAREDVPALLALAEQMTRALLEAEWNDDDDYYGPRCPNCGSCRHEIDRVFPVSLAKHSAGYHGTPERVAKEACRLDAALTAAGLQTAESRDAARSRIALRGACAVVLRRAEQSATPIAACPECCDAARKAADEGRRTGRDG